MTNPLKVAIVGIGWWSTPIGSGARRSDKLDLAACYTRSPEKRAAYAKDFGCAEAESYEDILADGSIEGVLITTPSTAHAGQIEAALRAGKHVWVEKGRRTRARIRWPRRRACPGRAARRAACSRWGTATAVRRATER